MKRAIQVTELARVRIWTNDGVLCARAVRFQKRFAWGDAQPRIEFQVRGPGDSLLTRLFGCWLTVIVYPIAKPRSEMAEDFGRWIGNMTETKLVIS